MHNNNFGEVNKKSFEKMEITTSFDQNKYNKNKQIRYILLFDTVRSCADICDQRRDFFFTKTPFQFGVFSSKSSERVKMHFYFQDRKTNFVITFFSIMKEIFSLLFFFVPEKKNNLST